MIDFLGFCGAAAVYLVFPYGWVVVFWGCFGLDWFPRVLW